MATWHSSSDGGYAQGTPAAASRHHEQITRLLDQSVPLTELYPVTGKRDQ